MFKFKNKDDYLAQRTKLLADAQGFIDGGQNDKAQEIMRNIEQMDTEYDAAATMQANLNAMSGSAAVPSAISDLTKGTKMGEKYMTRGEMLNSEEYRRAFMANVLKGEKIPAEFTNAAQQTATGDVGAVIPTVLVQKIFGKLEGYGKFYAMATKTNYKGGVTIPVSDIELVASWVGERGTADTQEAPVGSVTFAYHKLICKVAVTFETDTVTLEVFEADLVEKMSKAMVKAIEKAMFVGTGTTGKQPKGFLTETVKTGQNVDIEEGSHFTYATLVAAEAALPEGYEETAIWVMPKKTYYNEVVGLTDQNGQPIARVNIGIDGKVERVILGRRVEFAEYMSPFATTVTANTIVAAIFDFSKYAINTNHEITLKKYTDEDTDDTIRKALALIDGKTVDINSLVTVTVKNS